jgi:hypothetical protein
MGRFDALTQIEENQAPAMKPVTPLVVPAPSGENNSPLSTPAQPQSGKKQRTGGKKPATRQTGKSINALQPKQDKFDKYSTYLRPGYKRELKSIANDRDCKAYEVLDEALTLFFEARKK